MYPIPQNIQTGSVVVWTSAVQLVSNVPLATYDTAHCRIFIKAASTNTVPVYIGKSNVTANSAVATDWYELVASAEVRFDLWSLDKIYCISGSVNQKVTFLYVF